MEDARDGRSLISFTDMIDAQRHERFSTDGSLFQYYTPRPGFNVYNELTTLHVGNASNGLEMFTLQGANPFYGTAFSRDAKRIAIGFHGGSVKVYDIASSKLRLTLKGRASQVIGITFSPDDNRIFTGGLDGNVRVWDAYMGHEPLTLHAQKEVWALEISPNGQHLVAGCVDGSVKVWDAPMANSAAKLK